MHDEDRRIKLAAVQTHSWHPYRRDAMEKDWKNSLKDMVKGVRFPCSDWWNEYLHCVVS